MTKSSENRKAKKVTKLSIAKGEPMYEYSVGDFVVNQDLGKAVHKLLSLPWEPYPVGMKLKAAAHTLREKLSVYEANRKDLADKYGKKDDKGAFIRDEADANQIILAEETKDEFHQHHAVLLQEKISLPVIKASQFPKGAEVGLEFLAVLDGLVVDA